MLRNELRSRTNERFPPKPRHNRDHVTTRPPRRCGRARNTRAFRVTCRRASSLASSRPASKRSAKGRFTPLFPGHFPAVWFRSPKCVARPMNRGYDCGRIGLAFAVGQFAGARAVRSQIRLGQIFGIRIGLHYSWLLIALLIVYSLSSQFHASNPAWGSQVIFATAFVTALLFFVSLVLHELAHSLVAKSNGLQVREITLFALGGVSQIEKNPTSAKLEFWMALVGPLASVIIGAFCVACARVLGKPSSSPITAMLLWLGYINFTLAAFNLIPGYPLDGGRVLRAVIWWKTGNADRSTHLAARTGQGVAFAFILLGIFEFFRGAGFGGLWIAFIGWFLLQASRESDMQVGLKEALKNVRVADVMTRDCPTVESWLNLQNFVDEHLLRTGQRCFVVEQ